MSETFRSLEFILLLESRITEQLPDIWENVLSPVSGTRSHAGPFQASWLSTMVPWPVRAILGKVTLTTGLLSKIVTWLWPSASLSVLSFSFCIVSISSDHNQHRHCSRGSSLCFLILISFMSSNTTASLTFHNNMMLRCVPSARTLFWAPDMDIPPSLWCLLLDDPGTIKTTFPRLKAAFPLPTKTVHLSLHKWNGNTTHPFLQGIPLTTSPALLAISTRHNCHQQLSPTCNRREPPCFEVETNFSYLYWFTASTHSSDKYLLSASIFFF